MPVANVPSLDNVPRPEIGLDEEEISEITLGTFYVFDKENESQLGEGIRLAAARCGGCGRCGGGCAAARCGGAARNVAELLPRPPDMR
jgi:heterodisulfide reductase subunit C